MPPRVAARLAPSSRGGPLWRDAAVFAAAAFLFLIFQTVTAAAQGGQRDDGLVRLDQIDGGALLFLTDEPGLYVPAPIVSTDYDVSVAGPIARTVVTQRFTNPAEVFVEGKYVFPLPDESAVDALRMRVGDRLIEGDIKEREEAKEIFEEAKAEGFVASLVEQERPNLFTNSVANIGPNQTIVIQIEYQQTLAPRDGVFGLRLPLVVAPRYTPAPRVGLVRFGPNGWEAPVDDPVADRARITPPVADPRADAPGAIRNPVTISVDLEAGFPLGPIESLYHEVSVSPESATRAEVTLDGEVPADRDFFLSWRPERLSAPYTALFAETPSGDAGDTLESYVLMVTPPAAEAIGAARKPREVIFVQDISGSMFGESIEQAREGLEMAVRRLSPDDTFNIIVFNDKYGLFADAPISATPANIDRAVEAVRALEADGGTEMLPALRVALEEQGGEDPDRLRQVIFLTDGAVGNEQEMLALIERSLGRTRLFTVGIGSAPNSYFMTAAAESGRGSHVFIGDLAQVQDRMEALFERIETPAMTDLVLEIAGYNGPEIWPNPLPDLYAGDPLVATIQVDRARATRAIPEIRLTGARAGEPWDVAVPVAEAEARDGVGKLWARRKIRSLEALRLSPEMDERGRGFLDDQILATALDYGLVSRLTSLVAVDVTPTRPADAALVTRDVPLNLPDGWDAEAFFDNTIEAAPEAEPAPAPPLIQRAALLRLAAAAEARAAQAALGVAPPETALPWRRDALAGLALVLMGLISWVATRRRAAA